MTPWHSLPAAVFALVEQARGSVLLHTSLPSPEHPFSRLFLAPERVVQAFQPEQIPDLFAAIDRAVAAGQFAAGYFAFECGAAFEPTVQPICLPLGEPLAWFGIYPRCYLFDHRSGAFVDGDPPGLLNRPINSGATGAPCPILSAFSAERMGSQSHDSRAGSTTGISKPEGVKHPLAASFAMTEAPYAEAIAAIHEAIRSGDVYQLNFTMPLRFQVEAGTAQLYSALAARQPVQYSSFLHPREGRQILSFSPELFFRVDCPQADCEARRITTRPMKGTAARGRTTQEDHAQAAWLQSDTKNRAENLMIVDLIRSDLGRICQFGSVQVEDLFAVERYPTLWQMTSTVCGALRPAVSYEQIFRALFPCGSITGAPKVRAMQWIAQLETEPRGVYTGAIGFFSPQETVFSVAIRTLELEAAPVRAMEQCWQGKMGVGSGIVIDSNAAEEFRECALKAAFLTEESGQISLPGAAEFSLIETLRWKNGYPLLELHLDRLTDSANYFGFVCNREEARTALLARSAEFSAELAYKVRLLLNHQGCLSLSSESLPHEAEGNAKVLRVCIASQTTRSGDPMLFHKTTHRPLYSTAWHAARTAGFEDVLFFNQRGELTESAIANVFVVKDGRWFTPPIECGLLAGIQRRCLVEERPEIEERVLSASDLRQADAIYLSNAVRGLRRATICWEG